MLAQLTWQDVLAAAVTLWAVWYLARRVLGVVRRNRVTGCGTCAGCGGSAAREQTVNQVFVSADALANLVQQDEPGLTS